jgi:uncharacterized FAD-dependent dehydrogenase
VYVYVCVCVSADVGVGLARWANSALVVGIQAEDWAPWVREHGPLAGVRLQEAIEQRAWAMGGGGLVAPVQVRALPCVV